MSAPWIIHRQQHGYRSGHQLLTGSVKLPRADQDVVDRLSDISGPLKPGQTFDPYLTTYVLPSSSHYVIARTWQDRVAPRAGCVLTQSLLIPLDQWVEGPAPRRLLAALGTLLPDGDAAAPLRVQEFQEALPAVEDIEVSELVEALFLEERQPIVVFDSQSADIQARRLLISLWPEMRRDFCICTFALSPRKIEGRDFDLAYAPKSARARFAEWNGRRIESGNGQGGQRHRWTPTIADRIFLESEPRLLPPTLAINLPQSSRESESALRLSLLWDELLQRSQESPNAALGILDVLNSQGIAQQSLPTVLPVMKRALAMTLQSPSEHAWPFLKNFADKLPSQVPASLVASLATTSEKLASLDPRGAVVFLRNHDGPTPDALLKGIGDGLAASSVDEPFASLFDNIVDASTVGLMAASLAFARRLFQSSDTSREFFDKLSRLIAKEPATRIDKIRANVLPSLYTRHAVSVVRVLLHGLGGKRLGEAVGVLADATHFAIPEFDQPILDEAFRGENLDDVREVALSQTDELSADRFLTLSLRARSVDIEWLAKRVDGRRRLDLLVKLIDRTDDRELGVLLQHSVARDAVFAWLSAAPQHNTHQLARVLIVSEPAAQESIRLASEILPTLGADAENLASAVLERTLCELDVQSESIQKFASLAARFVSSQQLVQYATSLRASTAATARNLVLLSHLSRTANICTPIELLTERLTSRRKENLGLDGFVAWADLLKYALGTDAHPLRAAAMTFDHALSLDNYPAYPLISATFPFLYPQLPSRKGNLFWGEYDRKKAARHHLADAYMRSNWPPAELLLTAIEAGIASRVVGRLSRTYSGRSYLKKIEQDAGRLDSNRRKAVLTELLDASSKDADY